jgi:hypothetical protein
VRKGADDRLERNALLEVLKSRTGKVVTAVHRVSYQRGTDVNDDMGPIELTFDDDSTITFVTGANGQTLTLWEQAWVDPFVEPLDPANRSFVATSGKWTRFDVAETPDYGSVVGRWILDVQSISLPDGDVIGVVLDFGGALMRIEVVADELSVTIA